MTLFGYKSFLKNGMKFLGQNCMIFHTGMTTATPCLHGFKEKQSNPFVSRIDWNPFYFDRCQTILKKYPPVAIDHRTA